MKKLLAISLLLISLSVRAEVKPCVVRNLTIWNFDSFTEKCLKELGIDCCIVVIQPIPGLVYNEFYALTINNPGNFTIAISDILDYKDALSALAHELVHVRQIYSGELKQIGNEEVQYMGIKYKTSKRSHFTDPHEVDARIQGLRLFKKYKFIIQ